MVHSKDASLKSVQDVGSLGWPWTPPRHMQIQGAMRGIEMMLWPHQVI